MRTFLITSLSLSLLLLFLSVSPGTARLMDPGAQDKGIGPIKKVEIGPIDQKLVDEGKSLFASTCASCHKMDAKLVGPPLGKVAKEETPEFIMNLLLNTAEMQQKDPKVKKLVGDYGGVPMPQPSLDEKQARAVLEYLRSVSQ